MFAHHKAASRLAALNAVDIALRNIPLQSGLHLSLAVSERQLHLMGFSLADDLVTALTPNTPGEQFLPKLQRSLDEWAGN